jgi:CheY-like chemotaxis protein
MEETILIVDDEPDIIQVFGDILTGEGYRVISATGGMAALEIFKTEFMDLIITDIRMPGMDGVELTH